MARTISVVNRNAQGNRKTVVVDINITSYTAAGESITPADVGLKAIDYVDVAGYPGRPAAFNYTTNKLTVHQDNAVAAAAVLGEVAAATPLGVTRAKFEGIA